MAHFKTRTQNCTRGDALNRLAQAQKYFKIAEDVLADDSSNVNPGVATSNAVLSGIAASDAACCAKLGQHAHGQSHDEAAPLLATVSPGGPDMAKNLVRLLNRKTDSNYGATFVTASDAKQLVACAKRLLDLARVAVEA